MTIPNNVIETLETPQIQHLHWPNLDWKQLFWHSRCEDTLPRYLRQYRQAMLLIGSTSKRPNLTYSRLNTWEAMDESFLFRVQGREGPVAVQWVFSTEDDDIEWLMEHTRETLKAWDMTSEDLNSWTAEKLMLASRE